MAASAKRDLYLQVSGDIDPFQRALRAAKGTLSEFGTDAAAQLQEINDRFAQLGGAGADASAKALEKSFRSSFAAIQAEAKEALSGGNLGLDVGSADKAATAAEKVAVALRDRADAAARAITASDQDSAALRVYATAAAAAAAGAEEYARGLRDQATTLATVQSELIAVGRNQDIVAASHNRMSTSGMILQHVVRSTTDSFAAGLPVSMIFGEQISRLAEAASYAAAESGKTEGAFGKFASFMSGPWGLALQVAISILSSLATHMLAGSDAADKHAEAEKKLTEAIHDNWVEADKANKTAEQRRADDIAGAETKLREAIATRQATQAILDHAAAQVRAAQVTQSVGNGGLPGTVNAAAGMNELKAQALIDSLGGKAADESQAIIEAWETISKLRIPGLLQQVAEATDDSAAATGRYNRTLAEQTKLLTLGLISDAQFKQRMKEATDLRDQTTDHHANPKSTLADDDRLAEARAKVATATDAVQVAEAKLDLIRANRKNLTAAEYESELTAGLAAVNQAKQAAEMLKQLQSMNESRGRSFMQGLDAQDKAGQAERDRAFSMTEESDWYQNVSKPLQTPMQQYRQQLVDATGNWNKALQGVEVDGLKHVTDGLVGIISGTQSVAQAFKQMASAIISDLARIAIEKAIVSFIPGLGLKGGNVPGFATGRIPGFADGVIRGPGTGTSDSILALMDGVGLIRVSNGESIMTAHATQRWGPMLKAMNDNSLPGFAEGMVGKISYPSIPGGLSRTGSAAPALTVNVDARGAQNPEQVRAIARAAVMEAVPAIVAASQGSTVAYLKTPKLPGSLG